MAGRSDPECRTIVRKGITWEAGSDRLVFVAFVCRWQVRFLVPSSRNGSNTRFGPCAHDADANAPAGLSPGLPRVRTTVGTVPISVFRCLGVGSSTHLDTCVHEGGVRVDPELRLSLPRVYTTAEAMLVPVFLVSNRAGPSSFRVVCARALRETRIFHPGSKFLERLYSWRRVLTTTTVGTNPERVGSLGRVYSSWRSDGISVSVA